MNITRLIMASVAVRKVYRRFAQLSEEEKQQVVDKVKAKLKEKYPEAVQQDGHVKITVPVSGGDAAPDGDIVVTPVEDAAPETSAPATQDIINPDELDWGGAPEAAAQGGTSTDIINPEDLQWEEGAAPAAGTPADAPEGESPTDEEPTEVTASPEPDEELPDSDAMSDDDSMSDENEQIADDMFEDVEEIKDESKIEPNRVLDLFDSMMKMVTLLVHAKLPEGMDVPDAKFQKVAARLAEQTIAERVAQSVVGMRGLQMVRKDKDVMTDVGGSSKGQSKEPKFKPSRDDMKKPFRSKDKPAEDRDPDTDLDPDKRTD